MHANAYLLLLISNNAISSQNRSINQQMQIEANGTTSCPMFLLYIYFHYPTMIIAHINVEDSSTEALLLFLRLP
jgi:hypothetical protein